MPNGATIGPEGNGGSSGGGGGGSISTITSTGSTIAVSSPTGPTTNVEVANQAGVTPGRYGSSSSIPSFTVDQQGIITAASSNPSSFQTGPLTGDVTTPAQPNAATTLVATSNVESIISANSTVAGALQTTGGTMSGAIAMGSHKITGLTNGSASSDAAAFGQIPTVAWNVVAASTTHSSAAGEITLCTAGVGGFTVTLPAVVANEQVIVKKIDSGAGNITISPASGTIDGQSTVVINMQYQSFTLVSDGTNWFVIA